MCILLQRISNQRDFVKYISGKMGLRRKGLIAQKLLLRGRIKKYFPVHTCVHWSKKLGMHMSEMNRLHITFSIIRLFLAVGN